MVAEPPRPLSVAEIKARQMSEKRRIAAQYPDEDEDFAETILETPWRDTLEADVRAAHEAHMEWAAAERANGYSTFPSDNLFWMNVELLLPDYEQFLSIEARATPEGEAFMQRAADLYPPAVPVILRMDKRQ